MRIPLLDSDVLPLDIAEFAQTLSKCLEEKGLRCRPLEKTYAQDLRCLLRLDAKRCGEEGESEEGDGHRAHGMSPDGRDARLGVEGVNGRGGQHEPRGSTDQSAL